MELVWNFLSDLSCFLSQARYKELSHPMNVGERLISAQHYASEQIRSDSRDLEKQWERLKGVVSERVELFDLSVSFHETQQKVSSSIHPPPATRSVRF